MTRLALMLLLALAAGCASREVKQLREDVVGRWIGDAVSAPRNAWWEGARFDVSFAPAGVLFGGRNFTVVASTFAGHPIPLRFAGTYEVESAERIEVEELNLGGYWDVARKAKDEMTLTRGDMVLALRKRYGS